MLARFVRKGTLNRSLFCSCPVAIGREFIPFHARVRFSSDIATHSTSDTQAILPSVESLRSLGLPETHKDDIRLLKLFDMHREAEKYINIVGNYEQAADILAGALDWAKTQQLDSWVVGYSHLNLAFCFHQLRNYELALPAYEKGFEILPPAEHAQAHIDKRFMGMRYLNFAELLSCLGRHKAAAEACNTAVKVLEEGLGTKNDVVGMAMNNLASYLSMQGDYEAAVVANEKALGVLEHSLGRDNHVTRSCAVNLAKIYHTLKKTGNITNLDTKFQHPEAPVIPRNKATYPPDFVSKLRSKWESQGIRNVFDPPGLHRSSKVAVQTYSTFFSEWQKVGQKIEPCYYDIIEDETKSISYASDRIKQWTPPQLRSPTGELKEFIADFKHNKSEYSEVKLPSPVTSVHEAMEKRTKEDYASWDPVTFELTEEELAGVRQRQKEIGILRGEPAENYTFVLEEQQAIINKQMMDLDKGLGGDHEMMDQPEGYEEESEDYEEEPENYEEQSEEEQDEPTREK